MNGERAKLFAVFAQHGAVGIVLLVFMLDHFGYLPSQGAQALEAAEATHRMLEKHEKTAQDTQKKLDAVLRVLKRSADLQAITARQACLANAKNATERDKCAEID